MLGRRANYTINACCYILCLQAGWWQAVIIVSDAMTVQVYKESSKRAIDEQFGGEDETPPPAPGFTAPTLKLTKYSNAYMLVYVRQSSWKDIMLEVKENDIADHVRSRLEVGFPCSTFGLVCRLIALCTPAPLEQIFTAGSSANRHPDKCLSLTRASEQSRRRRAAACS